MGPRHTDRRSLLMAAGLAVAAAAAGPAAAEDAGLRGSVAFEGGGPIPEGTVTITLEDPAAPDAAPLADAATELRSDGTSERMDFLLPAVAAASPTLEVVAHLERADGWLIARGSAGVDGRSPAHIVLHAAIY